jgi:DNA modification methylase
VTTATRGKSASERTVAEYVTRMVGVFREVRRVLASDGTLWLNIGDTYNAFNGNRGTGSPYAGSEAEQERPRLPAGYGLGEPSLKAKDLIGVPWRLAFALQADGWWLRSDIVWSKPNPMPESVTDRPTKAHEYVFLMSRSPRYYYDAEAIMEPVSENTHARLSQDVAAQVGSFRANGGGKTNGPMKAVGRAGVNPKAAAAAAGSKQNPSMSHGICLQVEKRNARTVWEIVTEGFTEAHFATFPTELARRCILAGSRPLDVVLDPFMGAGTVGLVADRLDRGFVGIEIVPEYAAMAERRIASDAPLFTEVAIEAAPRTAVEHPVLNLTRGDR